MQLTIEIMRLHGGGATKTDADANAKTAALNVEAAKADLERVRASASTADANNPNVRAAQAALDRAEFALRNTRVVAPADGYVSNLSLAEGQFVAAGTPALTFINPATQMVIADFRENHAGKVRGLRPLVFGFAETFDEETELVAGQTTDHRFARQDARQSFGEHFERAVAGRMTERVVDFLEPVHVQIQHHDAAVGLAGPRNRLLQHVLELHAIRDFRECVIAGEIADATLGALALGDVADDEDRACKLRIVSRDRRARQ